MSPKSSTTLESIDVIASPVQIIEGSCLTTNHSDPRGREVQGPPVQFHPQFCHRDGTTDNLKPLLDGSNNQISTIRSNDNRNSLYDQIGSMEISFLQQLIDTRGPTNDNCHVSGSNQGSLFLHSIPPG